MTENINNYDIDKISESIITYMEFIKRFKAKKPDKIISPDNSKLSYIFREFNTDCYCINKNSLDSFLSSINFHELCLLLDPINDENKQKFKEKLKKYLEKNSLNLNELNVRFYSKKEEMKELVKNLNDYSFINEELLVNGMGIDEKNLRGNLIKVFKNETNTILLSPSNNFLLFFNKKKDLEGEEKIKKKK